MKNLIYTIALLVSFVSFGQNFPFEISKDFVKLNEEEKYDFLLQEYKGFKEKDFSFAKEFHNIKGNYEIYRRKDVDLIYENILIYTLNSNETIENIYEDFNRSKENGSLLDPYAQLLRAGIKVSFNDLGIKFYKNYYKYFYLSLVLEADYLGDRLNFKRMGFTYYLYIDKVLYQVSLNTVDNLDIDDVVIKIDN
tara:strand:+ start:62 stop:643 length:582 start_codon:yes stop_codon:yes gene_type:complete